MAAIGMVNADPGCPETTNVVNRSSDLIVERYGQDVGHHAPHGSRHGDLPLNYSVVVVAEVQHG
jgi:hypothetical protein